MASIDRRANGTYRARWREYPGGPQKTKSFARKVDATRFLTTVEHSILSGSYVTPSAGKTTFREFSEVYLSRGAWRTSSRLAVETRLRHVMPMLGARPLSSIRSGDVRAALCGLELGPSSVRDVRTQLAAVFAAAVEDGLVARSPVTTVKAPKVERAEVVPPTTAQVNALMAAAPDWYRPAIVLGAGVGLRRGEASGLTVDRVSWLERAIRVDRQWVTRVQPHCFTPPKTAASVRTIPVAASVLAELGRSSSPAADGFVVNAGGAPITHGRWGQAWRTTAKRAGVEGLTYHSLRHYFATCLISAGCSVRAVQHALGHSSASTTLNVYSHLFEADEDRIRSAVEAAFAPAEDSLRTTGDA